MGVDPQARDYECLKHSVSNRHVDIVRLLQDGRTNPSSIRECLT